MKIIQPTGKGKYNKISCHINNNDTYTRINDQKIIRTEAHSITLVQASLNWELQHLSQHIVNVLPSLQPE
jgi:predicted GTPase